MGVTISRYRRFWAVYEGENELVCLCVYRKGALEVSRRLGVPHPDFTETEGGSKATQFTERSHEGDGSPRNDYTYRRRNLRSENSRPES